MLRSLVIAAAIACVAHPIVAHDGVENPDVEARMHAMSDIGAQMKVLGTMAKGQVAFDAAAAQAAAALVAERAAAVPALFETQADDPKSEADPAIWADFEDFTVKAMALQTAAETATESLSSLDDLRGSLGAMGGTCKACHGPYRQ